jgi:hypothetical protein
MLSSFTEAQNKNQYLLNYPAASPGTDVTVSTFLWHCSLSMSLEPYKMKGAKLSFQKSAAGKACYSAL